MHRRHHQRAILSIVLTIVVVDAILSRPGDRSRYEGIADDPDFGCQWTQSELACNCREHVEKEFYVKEDSIDAFHIDTLKVTGCRNVRFGANAIKRMLGVRHVQLTRIANLTLDESALAWDGYRYDRTDDVVHNNLPAVSVRIVDSHVARIASNAFRGIYDEIRFEDVRIDEIAQYAFTLSSTRAARTLSLVRVRLARVEPQSFKKFRVAALVLDAVAVDELPSRAFSDLDVHDKLLLADCEINVLRSLAFVVRRPRSVEVRRTRVDTIEGDAFKIAARGNVLFDGDAFDDVQYGAFRGFTIESDDSTHRAAVGRIEFVDVRFARYTGEFLNVNRSSYAPELSRVDVNFACNCKAIEYFARETSEYGAITCRYEGATIALKEFKEHGCSVVAGNATLIAVVAVLLSLIVVVGAILFVYYKRTYKSDRYGSEKGEVDGRKNISLIVPDGKTYKETELHVIVERADLLTTDL